MKKLKCFTPRKRQYAHPPLTFLEILFLTFKLIVIYVEQQQNDCKCVPGTWFRGIFSALPLINGAVWHNTLYSRLPLTRKSTVLVQYQITQCLRHLVLTTIDFEVNYLYLFKKRHLSFTLEAVLNSRLFDVCFPSSENIRFFPIVVDHIFLIWDPMHHRIESTWLIFQFNLSTLPVYSISSAYEDLWFVKWPILYADEVILKTARWPWKVTRKVYAIKWNCHGFYELANGFVCVNLFCLKLSLVLIWRFVIWYFDESGKSVTLMKNYVKAFVFCLSNNLPILEATINTS